MKVGVRVRVRVRLKVRVRVRVKGRRCPSSGKNGEQAQKKTDRYDP